MKSSRQRILDYLQTRSVATSKELSQALQLSQADVRHHLLNLVKQGSVVGAGSRTQHGRGRPAPLYQLAAQEGAIPRLAHILLELILTKTETSSVPDPLNQIAAQLAGAPLGAAHLTQRLHQLTQKLNQLHYQARWEARAGAPRLYLGHCPYLELLPEHPELCQIDQALIEGQLQANAQQEARRAIDSRGAPYCLFLISRRTTPSPSTEK